MRFGSLFAGIGGFDIGLERSGMECAWQIEIDDYASRVLEKHWPNVPRYRDVRECGSHNLEPVDLICGGFPCQPHSLAGKRQGSADERDLWGEFARIVRELEPRWVLAENVPGLLSSESGRFFGRVLRDLAACGYDAEWQCIPAAAFGAPYVRERIFILAYPNCQADGQQHQHEEKRRDGNVEDTILADIDGKQRQASRVTGRDAAKQPLSDDSGSISANFNRTRQLQPRGSIFNLGRRPSDCGWWATEPDVVRMVYGIPNRDDRIRCLGNSVVPQIVEWIGKQIKEDHEKRRNHARSTGNQ